MDSREHRVAVKESAKPGAVTVRTAVGNQIKSCAIIDESNSVKNKFRR
jgi:hypothetical protein